MNEKEFHPSIENNNMSGSNQIKRQLNQMTVQQQFQGLIALLHGLEKVEKGDRVPSTHGAISTAQTQQSVNKILGYHGDLGKQIQILGLRWG